MDVWVNAPSSEAVAKVTRINQKQVRALPSATRKHKFGSGHVLLICTITQSQRKRYLIMSLAETATALIVRRRKEREDAQLELEQLEQRRILLTQKLMPRTEAEEAFVASASKLQKALDLRVTIGEDKAKHAKESRAVADIQASISARREALKEEQSDLTKRELASTAAVEKINDKERVNEANVEALTSQYHELLETFIGGNITAVSTPAAMANEAPPSLSCDSSKPRLQAPTALMGVEPASNSSPNEVEERRSSQAMLPYVGAGVLKFDKNAPNDHQVAGTQSSTQIDLRFPKLHEWQQIAQNLIKYEDALVAIGCKHEDCCRSKGEPANTPVKNAGQFFGPRTFAIHYGKAHKASVQTKTGQVLENITIQQALEAQYCDKRPVTGEEVAALERGEKPWAHVPVKSGHRGDSIGPQLKRGAPDLIENSSDNTVVPSSGSRPVQARKKIMTVHEYHQRKTSRSTDDRESASRDLLPKKSAISDRRDSGVTDAPPPTPAFGSFVSKPSTATSTPVKPTKAAPRQGWSSFMKTLHRDGDGSVSPTSPSNQRS
ncbi:hypothetical protein LTR86_010668 [Recurvomyces mirabilis]|nr:hypothetical protein LTR86_010668 [Recurvomyces mirabilis]